MLWTQNNRPLHLPALTRPTRSTLAQALSTHSRLKPKKGYMCILPTARHDPGPSHSPPATPFSGAEGQPGQPHPTPPQNLSQHPARGAQLRRARRAPCAPRFSHAAGQPGRPHPDPRRTCPSTPSAAAGSGGRDELLARLKLELDGARGRALARQGGERAVRGLLAAHEHRAEGRAHARAAVQLRHLQQD